jgi:hypothetical protein
MHSSPPVVWAGAHKEHQGVLVEQVLEHEGLVVLEQVWNMKAPSAASLEHLGFDFHWLLVEQF